MKNDIKYCVIIGASSGLGAALVEEFLNSTTYNIIGIARTKFEKIQYYSKWSASGRYRHIEFDITSSTISAYLYSVCSEFAQRPICVIFNAAIVEADVNKDCSINYDIFAKVNHVGIDGFTNILIAFEEYFLKYGGILIGVSSFSAFMPPFLEPRIAYPASKAYLDMVLRNLRIVWDKKVKVVTVHLGHLSNDKNKFLPRWLITTYPLAAKKIVHSISRDKISDEINYPILYCIIYKYIVRFIPDKLYLHLARILRYFIGL